MKEMPCEARCLKSNEDMTPAPTGQPKQLSHDLVGLKPTTSAMPVQCSHQLSYKVTQPRAGQPLGPMPSADNTLPLT